jgi:ribosomal protein S18 acetylase RimI-like enzyme
MEIRAATIDDYDAYARLVAELGIDDPTPSRARFGDELVARTLVAVDRTGIVGYALFEILTDTGYVRNLVSDPARRRSGVGVALMDAMRVRFAAAGATAWCLNVKPDNLPAIRLYERFGLREVYRSHALRLPAAAALPPPPPDLELVPVAPDDDALVERTLRLLPGQLASSRSRPTRRVVQLRRAGEVLGVAVFSGSIPGAFPFRVVDPGLAAGLLAHLRAFVPPGAPYLQVGVEDDDALRAAVVALGARVHREIMHMRGPLAELPPAQSV